MKAPGSKRCDKIGNILRKLQKKKKSVRISKWTMIVRGPILQ